MIINQETSLKAGSKQSNQVAVIYDYIEKQEGNESQMFSSRWLAVPIGCQT
jgi:hypothetical protein